MNKITADKTFAKIFVHITAALLILLNSQKIGKCFSPVQNIDGNLMISHREKAIIIMDTPIISIFYYSSQSS